MIRDRLQAMRLKHYLVFLVLLFIVVASRASYAVQALDQYGGTTGMQCPNGPKPHFYTEKIENRWWICDPAGNGFFLKSVANIVYNVDNEQYTLNQTKYATGVATDWRLNWSLEMINRLQAWGFNVSDGYYNLSPFYTWNLWPTSDQEIPVKMPMDYSSNISRYAFQNSNNCSVTSAVKDMLNGITTNPVFTGYGGYSYGDYFDPNFSTCLGNILAAANPSFHGMATGVHNDYLIFTTIDELDQLGGLLGPGPDFPTLPSKSLGANAAWVTLATAPTQSGTSTSSRRNWLHGGSYSNTAVYTKRELSRWLSSRYGGKVSALNAAWESSYTTFGASGAGWGVGSGILDEDGTCPSRGAKACWMGDDITLAGETAAMQADMSAFYSLYLDQYFSVMQAQWHNPMYGAPGIMLTMTIGGWGTPPRKEALTEASKYLDLIELSAIPPAPWSCIQGGGCPDSQARVDFVSQYVSVPWWNWEGIDANPDSAESAYPSSSPYTTQAQRGAALESMVSGLVNAKDTATGTYHIVGFQWWDMFDMNGEQLNWGLITPLDNPYDGRSATTKGIKNSYGKDQWGYRTGGEKGNYGNFIDRVKSANDGVYQSLSHLRRRLTARVLYGSRG